MSAPLDPAVLSRARGAWLGQITGDALGTTLEFKGPAQIATLHPGGLREVVGGGPFRVLPGQVTDDTELALALARSLAERRCYDPDAVAAAYVAWYRSGPFDVGGTTAAAFGGRDEPGPGLAARVARRASANSQANGSVMRLSPLAIWGWRLPPDQLAALAAFDARLSHPHPVCQAANAIHAHAVALAIREGTNARETYERTREFARSDPRCAPLVGLLTEAAVSPPADFVKNMGWVLIALQNAFYRLLHAKSFEEGLVETVMQGGDTDTNGCIAGALLGAVHGEEAIPARWRSVVLACRTGRGATYQAHDARELALRLVEAGSVPGAMPDLEGALRWAEVEEEGEEQEPAEWEDEEGAEGDWDEEEPFEEDGFEGGEADDGTELSEADDGFEEGEADDGTVVEGEEPVEDEEPPRPPRPAGDAGPLFR